MPSRNIVKLYDTDTYYHVYNRGVEKRKIFIDDQDYYVFLSLLRRYLGEEPCVRSQGREYDWLAEDIEVVAFCLMPNHFHLLVYQIEIESVTRLIRAVCSSYATYFNKKYHRVGSLFQGTFKAIRVNDDGYLLHLTRYIHRNPYDYLNWRWSSLDYWLGKSSVSWVKPDRLSDSSAETYLEFIQDDDDYKSTKQKISSAII